MRKTTYFGNPWVGMFVKTNDEITVLPVDSMKKLDAVVEENLKTEIVRVSAADSNLLGIYFAMNSNGIVLPNVMREDEIAVVRKCGLNVYVSRDKHNAHGNNIAVNDKGGIINPNISRKEVKAMEDVFGVELVSMGVAGYTTVGSSCIATNTGFLAHYRIGEDEMKEIKDALKVRGNKGTANTGTGFVSYGIVVNKNGYIAGENTTAFELGRLEEALDLIR